MNLSRIIFKSYFFFLEWSVYYRFLFTRLSRVVVSIGKKKTCGANSSRSWSRSDLFARRRVAGWLTCRVADMQPRANDRDGFAFNFAASLPDDNRDSLSPGICIYPS